MSTRGNVIFANYWTIRELKKHFIIDYGKALTRKKEESDVLKDSYKIYIHSDMYPKGTIPWLQEFLQLDGAKHRASDTSYLSAWFVAFKCINLIPFSVAMSSAEKIYPSKVPKTLDSLKKSRDWLGIGLENQLADDANYTYVIVPNVTDKTKYKYDEISFDIHIFSGALDKYLGVINSEDDIDFSEESWLI